MSAAGSAPVAALTGAEAALAAGPLARAGGIAVVPGLPDPATCRALAAEAYAAYPTSHRQDVPEGDLADGRGGMPARGLNQAPGGPVQDAVYGDPRVHAYLADLCGVPVRPGGGRGTFSYYVRPGDFLGLHLDVDTCDVTLVTVLHDTTSPAEGAGALVTYRSRLGGPLSAVRAAPDAGAELVKATPGSSVVLLGGLLPHRVLPVTGSGQRIISALCFSAA